MSVFRENWIFLTYSYYNQRKLVFVFLGEKAPQ